MSYHIYYTIRANEKTHYTIESLFFGEHEVYDFKRVIFTEVYDTYEDALKEIYEKKLINVHIRKTISTSGDIIIKDYRTAYNVVYKGNDFRKTNSYPYDMRGQRQK